MSTAIALAAPDPGVEAQILARAAAYGIDIRRRCVDAADLLGACLGAPGLVAVVTAGLPRLSPEIVTRLHDCGSAVIGVALNSDDRAALELLNIDSVIDCAETSSELIVSLAQALLSNQGSAGVWNVEAVAQPTERESGCGRLIAVWGPAGAPGRTTTAMLLARALSERDRTAIIDADTSAPSLALQLGLAEDLSGLIVACRHAETGSLSTRTLASSMSKISDRYFALTGLSQPRRWPELRPAALTRVLDQVRLDFPYAVVDVGCSFHAADALTPSPTSVADTTLATADVILAVCQADPLGVARFLGELPELIGFGVPIVGFITKGAERDQARQLIRETASRAGISIPVTDLGLEHRSLTAALRRGNLTAARHRRSAKNLPSTRLIELVA